MEKGVWGKILEKMLWKRAEYKALQNHVIKQRLEIIKILEERLRTLLSST